MHYKACASVRQSESNSGRGRVAVAGDVSIYVSLRSTAARKVPAAHASRICARVATHAAAKVRGKARVHDSAALVDSCDRAQSLGRQIELQWPPSIMVEHYAIDYKDKDVMSCGTRRSPLRIVCVYIIYHLLSIASQRSVPPYLITNSVPLQHIIGLPPSNAYFGGES